MQLFGPQFSPFQDLLLFFLGIAAFVLSLGTPVLVLLGIRALWHAGSAKHARRVEESLYYISKSLWAIDMHLRGHQVEGQEAVAPALVQPSAARRVANSMFGR